MSRKYSPFDERYMEWRKQSTSLPVPSLNCEDAALLIIDMQYADAHRDYGLGKKAREKGFSDVVEYYFERIERLVLPNLYNLLKKFRELNMTVVHVHIASQTFGARDTSRRYKLMEMYCEPGSKDSEIVSELTPEMGELVFPKTTSGLFNSTMAEQALKNMGVRTLVVGGVVTSNCVETTVRDACDRGFDVAVVDDGCAAFTEEDHQWALMHMANGYAHVMQCEEVLNQLDRQVLVK